MLTGPPPKFHGTRDILALGAPATVSCSTPTSGTGIGPTRPMSLTTFASGLFGTRPLVEVAVVAVGIVVVGVSDRLVSVEVAVLRTRLGHHRRVMFMMSIVPMRVVVRH